MNLKSTPLKLIYLGFIHFFLVGFLVLLIVNLVLRDVLWPFFSYSIYIPILNIMVSLLALWLGTKLLAPVVKLKLDKVNPKHLVFVSGLYMFFAVLVTLIYLFDSLSKDDKIIQMINGVLLVVFFFILSYNYIVKKNNIIY